MLPTIGVGEIHVEIPQTERQSPQTPKGAYWQ
jgi:hypothetical protein